MKLAGRALIVGAVALAMTACPSSRPSGTATTNPTLGPGGLIKPFIPGPEPAAGLDRPLHLPRVGAGQRCPVTTGNERKNEFVAGYALGLGPAYPIIVIEHDAKGVYHYGSMITDNKWWIIETNWMVDARDKGAILLRGARLSGDGLIRFVTTAGTIPQYRQTATGMMPPIELYRQLVFLTGKDVPQTAASGAREFASATAILGPGCYAFQVDGKTFSRTIVFQMAP